MGCLHISFSLMAANPEETKPMLPSLIKVLRVDGVYSFLKRVVCVNV